MPLHKSQKNQRSPSAQVELSFQLVHGEFRPPLSQRLETNDFGGFVADKAL